MKFTNKAIEAACDTFTARRLSSEPLSVSMKASIEAAMQSMWVSVNDRLPPENCYVLARAPSGYSGTKYRYTEARYDKGYSNSWRTSSNDAVTDFGEAVTDWMPLP